MKTTVLDASAILALFFDEPGAGKVENLLHRAAEDDKRILIAAVNWAEVLYKMQRKNGAEGLEGARHFGRAMPLEVAPMDRELAEAAAQLKAAHNLGLAEAFAAALAKSKKADLVTADTDFNPLEKEIKIVWLTTDSQ
ncbi:MAG: PIN domain-containing protein [Verrucomicrobiota bacterium]